MKSTIYRDLWLLNFFLFTFLNSWGQIQPLPTNYSVSLLKDINPGSGSSFSGRAGVAIGNTLYFSGSSEVWKTTGTEASTMRVKDLNPNGGSDPNYFTNLNGVLFFAATGPSGREIYKSDGTANGTILIKDINPGGDSDPSSFLAYNDVLLFRADNGADGEELWRTDGTSVGTWMVKNINKTQGSRPVYFNGKMAILNNVAYFLSNDGLTGDELWRSDGTEAGTYLVRDINPAGSIGTYDIVAMGNFVYFLADDGTHGTELWRSDGTAAGTGIVRDLQQQGGVTQLSRLVVANNILFMSLEVNGDSELYRSDGTALGTVRIKNINTSGGSGPQHLTKVGSQVFFTAYEPVYGTELWKSDGTAAGTILIKDLTVNGSSDIQEMTEAHGRLFFTLESDEPHVSNGTAEGTKRIANINPSGFAVSRNYMALGTQVFFFAGTPDLGRELYKAFPCNVCPIQASSSASLPAPAPAQNADVKVLGNPITGSLNVEIPSTADGPITVELLTRNGLVLEKREIQQADIPSPMTFDVKKQPTGLLLLRVRSRNGSRVIKITKVD
jgi:ELWxxDGT repeat protein